MDDISNFGTRDDMEFINTYLDYQPSPDHSLLVAKSSSDSRQPCVKSSPNLTKLQRLHTTCDQR